MRRAFGEFGTNMSELSDRIALLKEDAEIITGLLPKEYQNEAKEILTKNRWVEPWGNLLTRIIKDLETA